MLLVIYIIPYFHELVKEKVWVISVSLHLLLVRFISRFTPNGQPHI